MEVQPDAGIEGRIQKLETEAGELRSWLGQVLAGSSAAFLGVGAFLGFQVWQSGKELESRAVLHQQIQMEQAKFDSVVEQLRRFGASHPDYVPILQRHGVELPQGAAAGPGGNPLPAKPVQPGKN